MRIINYTYPNVRSPYTGFESEIDRLFRAAYSDAACAAGPRQFPVDLYEDKDNAYVRAELPGVARDAIGVDVVNGALTIQATRKVAASESESVSFSRTVKLADDVDAEKVSAAYENGVLTVTLPKREEAKPRKVTVAVK